jgi:Uncharacterized conserved protein (DUF2278)
VPLTRYGVLVGTLHRHFRDQPDTQGRWFHVNLEVDAPAGRYRCAVDVDSKLSSVGVGWQAFAARSSSFGGLAARSDGYHELARDATSGAVDVLRHPAFRHPPGCAFVRAPDRLLAWLRDRLAPRAQSWTFGSNQQAADAFEPMLVVGRRVFVFGEPFDVGLGMHNIHQNQGDPAGSQWWDENGIWQDGVTIAQRPDGRLDVFASKFSTQSDRTDDDGHPV